VLESYVLRVLFCFGNDLWNSDLDKIYESVEKCGKFIRNDYALFLHSCYGSREISAAVLCDDTGRDLSADIRSEKEQRQGCG